MDIGAERTLDKSDVDTTQASLVIDPKREAKLVRKLDIYIAPIMTIIFLTAYLDRSNIGNAASAGMTEDIGMSSGELGSKYKVVQPLPYIGYLTACKDAVTLFYVTYVAAEIPCSLVLKKFHPSMFRPLYLSEHVLTTP